MDDNIDTSDSASHNKMYRIQRLYDDLQNHISTFNLTLHNKEFTRYVPHQPPSTIDHISSNCPRKNLFEICNRYSYFLLTKNMTWFDEIHKATFELLKNQTILQEINMNWIDSNGLPRDACNHFFHWFCIQFQ